MPPAPDRSAATDAVWAAKMAVNAHDWAVPPAIGGEQRSILPRGGTDWPVNIKFWRQAVSGVRISELTESDLLPTIPTRPK